ncbi:flavin-containing monooxygenase [Zavarzinia sp. CC-PAN008]|uniref:flavin-containing monooxygenase n=1 Tax=Zavarzinia sp. CC-PAN008 TaxID=3243332 RepID=UPI003F74A55E
MPDQSPASAAGFDPDAIRARYQHERDRRLRRDGATQYVEAAGRFAHYGDDDPHADPAFARAPVRETVEVLVVGGGFGGLMVAARLRDAGVDSLRIVEDGADFGGTWYWNRYPGAQCDIESYIYLPLLEETGYMPREKYAFQPEILAHTQRLARHFDLYPCALFQTRVTAMRWDEDARRWHVATSRGDAIAARFVIVATGPANRPKLPGIPGLDSFAGHTFHTARWDYAYTGGDTTGGLTGLADKRVAIIGTGATAIQVVPHVGRHARHLYVFQRTPSSVDLRGNRPTDPAWAAGLKPGWQRERQDNFNAVYLGEPTDVDLVDDMWTDMRNYRPSGRDRAQSIQELMAQAELADMRKMSDVRARVDAVVKDRATAEALKAWYPRLCKRPCFHDDYLPTFNRPNVTLVDTSASLGVERITPQGVVANGVEYPVDCIIFATGFEITSSFQRRLPIDIRGQGGRSLTESWARSVRSFHGYASHGFPNWFFLGGNQNGISPNYTSMLAGEADQIAYVIGQVRARGALSVQPTAEAEAEWVATIRRLGAASVGVLRACTPGYYNNEGQIAEDEGRALADFYTPGLNAFNRLLRHWRDDGTMAGMALDMPAEATPA